MIDGAVGALHSRMHGDGEICLISVVDDDEGIRESLFGFLRSVGFAVQVFSRCEDFLASASLSSTECLILDVQLPGAMSGPELQEHLRARIEPAPPIVFITGRHDERVRLRVLAAGAVAYLTKPFDRKALLSALHSAVGPT
jgi:FixJ family two-component response regulator